MYKLALPICELISIEAKEGNAYLMSSLRQNSEVLKDLRDVARMSRGSVSGIGRHLNGLVETLKATDKQFAQLLRDDNA